MATQRVLPPEVVARLSRLRLRPRRRVEGRYAGGHASRRFGSSLDFADYRAYAPGDDPRSVDRHAYARLGRLLVKLYEAEDEAALRVVVDASASMGFGDKAARAREVAAALVAVAAGGGDRVRVLIAGHTLDPGPWLRGPGALPIAEARLLEAEVGGESDLVAALRRAHAEGPRGPVVLVSDLLVEAWEEVVLALAGRGGDALLVHLLGRSDLEPGLDGDLRVVDAETGQEIEIAADDAALRAHAQTRDAWLDAVDRVCGARGVAVARLVDDESAERLLTTSLTRLGIVA